MAGRVATLNGIKHQALVLGADEVQITEEDYTVMIRVSGMDIEGRKELERSVREELPVPTGVEVLPMRAETTAPLTDAEFVQVVSAMPDHWDEERIANMGRYDFYEMDLERLQPLIKRYGGVVQLMEAAAETAAEAPVSDSSDEADPSPSESNERPQRPAQRNVEAVKDAYVNGDIGEVELEKRLDDVMEMPEDLTPDTL